MADSFMFGAVVGFVAALALIVERIVKESRGRR